LNVEASKNEKFPRLVYNDLNNCFDWDMEKHI